jgi:hypothetical protein|tara:strand:+ start:592 stop:1053 length:462 start_codon:yes stop_codon:yes gene_type:complete
MHILTLAFGWAELLEVLGWMLLSIVKFVVTPSLALAAGVPPLRVFAICTTGAAVGIAALYPLSRRLFAWRTERRIRKGLPVFTTSRRRVVHIKQRWGLWGIVAFSGAISVPIAVLLGAKYFGRSRWIIPALMLSFTLWAAVLTYVSWRIIPSP